MGKKKQQLMPVTPTHFWVFHIMGIITEGSISTWLLTRGFGNAQARRVRALLFPFPKVNKHVDMYPENFINFIE